MIYVGHVQASRLRQLFRPTIGPVSRNHPVHLRILCIWPEFGGDFVPSLNQRIQTLFLFGTYFATFDSFAGVSPFSPEIVNDPRVGSACTVHPLEDFENKIGALTVNGRMQSAAG